MTTPTDITSHIRTYKELLNLGKSSTSIKTQVRKKNLIQLRRGVYATAKHWNTWNKQEQSVAHAIAYALTAQSPVFTHLSAAHIHGLDTLSTSEAIHIAQSSASKQAPPGVKLHRYNHDVRQQADFTPHGVYATNIIQTVVDCARSYGSLEGTVIADNALRAKAHYPELHDALLAVSGYGQKRARTVAECMSVHSESAGESITRFRPIELGLPMPQEQVSIPTPYGVYRPDFVWMELKIILEFDGRAKYYDYGDTSRALVRERDREKALTNAGWTVLRTNWESVYLYPERLERDLRRAFAAAR